MKQMTKILVTAGIILSFFTVACNKNNRPENVPDNISSAVILSWNEVAFETMDGSANQHSLLMSRIYAMVHAALAYFFGDKTTFIMNSSTAVPAGAPRSFSAFSQAANENATSRVMAGIHFKFSCDAGQNLGNKIGKWTVDNHLKPINY